jgi:hypothetical protein
MACPRSWQEKYAEVNEEVEADGKQLLSSFTAYHAADLRAPTPRKKSSDRPIALQDQRRGGKHSGRDYHRDNRDGYRRKRNDRGYVIARIAIVTVLVATPSQLRRKGPRLWL